MHDIHNNENKITSVDTEQSSNKRVKIQDDETPDIKIEKTEIKVEDFFTEPLPPKDQQLLYGTIHKHLKFQVGTFPGSHNVTFMRKHFTNLLEENYLCSEKSDGKRILLLILDINSLTPNTKINSSPKYKVFFIDRTNNIFNQKNLYFQIKTTQSILDDNKLNGKKEYFFFDCEIVKTFQNKIRIYIFDTLIYLNNSVCRDNLLKRLEFGRLFLKQYNILYKDKSTNKSEIKDDDGFKIKLKEMYKSYGFSEIYKNIDKLEHKNDGLCFTPVFKPYSIGIDNSWLKWKPSHLNTIDFVVYKMTPELDMKFTSPSNFIKKENGGSSSQLGDFTVDRAATSSSSVNVRENSEDDIVIYGMFVTKTSGTKVFFDYYIPYYDTLSTEIDKDDCLDLNGLICEFQFANDMSSYSVREDCFVKGGWTLYKIRRDKNKPNTVKIAKNILISINEGLGIKDLEQMYKEIKYNWVLRNN
ncbi:mRNA-capping enzyme subunit alpha [Cucumispora dikerogammari]|nr:mRNA-capping enzyme subunit alpha [Cucumispora dikerogammari]